MAKFKFQFFIFIAAILSFGLTSCGDDIECTETAINAAIQAEVNNVNQATTTFNNDPTSDNCGALLDALDQLIDEFRDLEDCADEVGQGAEFRQDLQNIENDRDLLSC